MKRTTTTKAIAATLVLAGVAAACGGSDAAAPGTPAPGDSAEAPTSDAESDTTVAETETTEAETETTDAETESTDAEVDSGDAVCPPNMVIQTDWWPESEHGGTYQLMGEGAEADAALFKYSGPIDPAYAVGGVETIEIRAGGDAIEFSPVVAEMKSDQDITIGYVNTDDAFQSSATVEVTGVAATLEINPQMIQWDPTQLEIDAADPTTIQTTGARLLHFSGTTYIDWMISKGYLDEGQSDPNYGGSPADWISAGGDFIQQGFVTNEIFKYENEIEWKDGAPGDLDYALIHDLGWQPYPAMYSVLSERLDELSPCLEVFVPMLQQAWVDYLTDPEPVLEELIDVTGVYNNYWKLSPELNTAALALFESEGIADNGPDDTYGNFDDARVSALFDEITGVLADREIELADGYTAESAYTNEFIDDSIGL
jgi:hypothetical protein